MKARKEDYLTYPWMYIILPSTRIQDLYPFLSIGYGTIAIATKLSYSHVIPHFVEYLRSKIPVIYREEIQDIQDYDFTIIDFYPFDIEE